MCANQALNHSVSLDCLRVCLLAMTVKTYPYNLNHVVVYLIILDNIHPIIKHTET